MIITVVAKKTPTQSLLKKAQEAGGAPHRKPQTADELELALAYLRQDVTARQVCTAVGLSLASSSNNAVYWSWRVLREAMYLGKIQVTTS